MARKQHHAVVVPSTGFGHMNPALELARQIALRGIEVTFIVFHEHLPVAQRRLLKASGFDSTRDSIHLVSFPHPFRGDDPSQPIAALLQLLQKLHKKPTALVSDCFVKCQDAADELGIPRIVFWTAAAVSDKIFASVPLLLSTGHIPVHKSSLKDEIVTVLPGMPVPLPTKRLPLCFHGPYFDFTPHSIACTSDASRAQGFVVNSIEEIEADVVAVQRANLKNYFPVGPLILPEIDQVDAADHPVMQWLDSHPAKSVLYIAFGTESMLPQYQFEKLVNGLVSSKQAFVWSLRRLVPEAGEELYENAKKRLTGQGLVVDWAPQKAVLDHPSVGAFFTHGGWNSTLETLCAGVPTLCWPFGAEQNMNTLLMSKKWGMGIEVAEGPESDVTEEEIGEAVKEVMKNAGLREKAMEMKELTVATVKPEGSSYRNMRDFVSKYFPH